MKCCNGHDFESNQFQINRLIAENQMIVTPQVLTHNANDLKEFRTVSENSLEHLNVSTSKLKVGINSDEVPLPADCDFSHEIDLS
jgi:hypothetical protein